MNNPNPRSNPFQAEDYFAEVVAFDNQVSQRSKESYQVFLSKYQSKFQNNPNSNQFTSVYLSFVNFFTKNIFAATGLMIVVASAFGASAAQFAAPTVYKPSTLVEKIFKGNIQSEIPKYTSLKSESGFSVYDIDKCGITVKYPSSINEVEVIPFPSVELNKSQSKIIDGITLDDSNFTSNAKDIVITKPLNQFSIECFLSQDFLPNLPENKSSVRSMNVAKLQEETGWFVAKEANLENIFSMTENGIIWYYFDFQDKTYLFTSRIKNYTPDLRDDVQKELFENGYYKKPGIFTQQLQFQFNSLAKAPLTTKSKSLQSSKSSITSTGASSNSSSNNSVSSKSTFSSSSSSSSQNSSSKSQSNISSESSQSNSRSSDQKSSQNTISNYSADSNSKSSSSDSKKFDLVVPILSSFVPNNNLGICGTEVVTRKSTCSSMILRDINQSKNTAPYFELNLEEGVYEIYLEYYDLKSNQKTTTYLIDNDFGNTSPSLSSISPEQSKFRLQKGFLPHNIGVNSTKFGANSKFTTQPYSGTINFSQEYRASNQDSSSSSTNSSSSNSKVL